MDFRIFLDNRDWMQELESLIKIKLVQNYLSYQKKEIVPVVQKSACYTTATYKMK